jgi:hypothetical protein
MLPSRRQRCAHLMALLALTENSFAVARADLPLPTILTKLVRKSCEYGRAMGFPESKPPKTRPIPLAAESPRTSPIQFILKTL